MLFAHLVAAVEADAEAIAAKREVTDLCPHWTFHDHFSVDVELGGAERLAVLSGLFPDELHPQRMLARSERWRDELLFRFDAEEVIDVVQLAILDEERVAAEAGAMRENHAAGIGGDVDVGDDLVRPATDIHR